MHISEVAMVAAVTLGIAGFTYATLNTEAVTEGVETVAGAADCRTVNTAILAYMAQHDATPRTVVQLEPYVLGDISAYRIVHGRAVGPGCPR